MDVNEATIAVSELYPALYRLLHRRRDPRAYRPSPETMAVLQHLADTGPLTVGEAAKHFDRSQGATSELLKRLLDRGMVERIEDHRDRRRHLFWLSESGEALWREEQQVLSREHLQRALAELPGVQRAALVSSLAALLRAAEGGARHLHTHVHEQRGERP